METPLYCCNKCTSGTGSARIEFQVKLMLNVKVGLTLPIQQRERAGHVERVRGENCRVTTIE
jgi:hypothetical protein